MEIMPETRSRDREIEEGESGLPPGTPTERTSRLSGKIVKIETDPSRCVGCLSCQLICSLTYEKVFNPSKSRILIERGDDGFKINFTDKCTLCGLCVEFCVYDALEAKR
jgi:formate hydrogenlyase subunit 6/NADH:ubiquinone oxidoreductase subunit I